MQLPFLNSLLVALLAISSPRNVLGARTPGDAVLLSSIKSLTLRGDKMTTARRVAAIPQLNCVGGSARGLYDVDTMRCTNSGSSYGSADIEWTCKASLPPEFKLGSTDVICEGYSNSEDDYVLKGSCGVEYRLVLTAMGEEKYGKRRGGFHGGGEGESGPGNDVVAYLFWFIFGGVLIWMAYAAFFRPRQQDRVPPRIPPRGGYFGGGGGGDNDDNNDEPPPPYSPTGGNDNNKKSSGTTNTSYGTTAHSNTTYQAPQPQQAQQPERGWRPGFWTGTAAGAAAGAAARYFAGDRRPEQRAQQEPRVPRTWNNAADDWQRGGRGSGWGAGPSMGRRSGSSGSSSSSAGPSYSANRYESTGFGSTSRR